MTKQLRALLAVSLMCVTCLGGVDDPGWVTRSPERDAIASDIVLGRVGEFRLIATEPDASHPYLYATEMEVTAVEKGDLHVGDRINVQFHTIYGEDKIERARRFGSDCAPRLWAPYPSELARVYLIKQDPSTYATDYPDGMLAIGDYLDSNTAKDRKAAAKAKAERIFFYRSGGLGLSVAGIVVGLRSLRKRKAREQF